MKVYVLYRQSSFNPEIVEICKVYEDKSLAEFYKKTKNDLLMEDSKPHEYEVSEADFFSNSE